MVSRPKSEVRKRALLLSCRVDEEEKSLIRAAADREGFDSTGSYLRSLALADATRVMRKG